MSEQEVIARRVGGDWVYDRIVQLCMSVFDYVARKPRNEQ